jgi:protein tyrosine phosphatase (PTP) superfamily phosphohydrolase (DUF442 family)
MTATLAPPAQEHEAPAPEALPVEDRAAAPEPGRGWGRRVLRLVAGFAVVLLVGNLLILGAHAYMRSSAPASAVEVPDDVAAIRNFEAIDGTLWRGGAPGAPEYRALAAAGVTTIVDLRAEEDIHVPEDLLDELGLTLVAIPIRDGQTPTTSQVERFLAAVDASEGPVYLHCGAGVGRTGTMAAAYSVSHGANGWQAMRANLAVGPPSLEQLAFAASLDAGETAHRPNAALVAISRTLDAPRRIWKVIESR